MPKGKPKGGNKIRGAGKRGPGGKFTSKSSKKK